MMLDLEATRRRLEAELARAAESIAQATDAGGTVMLDQTSVGRISRMDAMQQQAMAQAMRERALTQQRRLAAALARIDAGSYGRCCECGVDIDPARLDNDPAAVFCSDCMAEREAGRSER